MIAARASVPCSQTEFPCPSNLVCDGTHCVEPACSAIDCPEGLVCRAGQCVDACSAVTCPIDQLCETGICVDPCKNVTCDTGTVCSGGACVASCGCAGCPAGKVCQADGSCVHDGCQTQSCGAGQVCVKGTCTTLARARFAPVARPAYSVSVARLWPVTAQEAQPRPLFWVRRGSAISRRTTPRQVLAARIPQAVWAAVAAC